MSNEPLRPTVGEQRPAEFYRCLLFFKAEFTPGERKEMRPIRACVIVNGKTENGLVCQYMHDITDLSKIQYFRATDMRVDEPSKFYLMEVMAGRFPQRAEAAPPITMAFFDAKLVGGRILWDTCAPSDLVVTCENWNNQPDKLEFIVTGKCLTYEPLKAGT